MLPSIFWSTLQFALGYTLPFCLTVLSVLFTIAHTQPTWVILWSKLFQCFQVHSLAYFEEYPQLHSMPYSQPGWLSTSKSAIMMLPNIVLSRLSNPLPIALNNTLPVCLSIPFQIHSPDASKSSANTLPSTLPCTFSTLLLNLLWRYLSVPPDGSLPVYLTIFFQVHTQAALKHTPNHALNYTFNCTRWYTSSLPYRVLPVTLS